MVDRPASRCGQGRQQQVERFLPSSVRERFGWSTTAYSSNGTLRYSWWAPHGDGRGSRAATVDTAEQRRDVPKRVEVRDINERAMVKLATERKHLTDIIKMVAYQAESDLLALLRHHYARVDQEGRTLLHELFATAGDIRVTDRELHITLAPLSSPHRTRAARPSAKCSTKPRLSSPALACGCASPCVRHLVSVLPSQARGRDQHRHRRRPGSLIGLGTGHFCAVLCQEVLSSLMAAKD